MFTVEDTLQHTEPKGCVLEGRKTINGEADTVHGYFPRKWTFALPYVAKKEDLEPVIGATAADALLSFRIQKAEEALAQDSFEEGLKKKDLEALGVLDKLGDHFWLPVF